MTEWRFYRLADGVFTGRVFRGRETDLAANTPPGTAAFAGPAQAATQRVDLVTGALVAHRPTDAKAEGQAHQVRLVTPAAFPAGLTQAAASRRKKT